jgi:tryptophan synthase beta chain
MHTLGSQFTPPGFHAGGLRYHGMAPMVSHCKELGLMEAVAYNQVECFEAGVLFARCEGIVPAPEANHAVKGAIVEALRCKAEGKSETILFNLCGHGHFDMVAYQKYFLVSCPTENAESELYVGWLLSTLNLFELISAATSEEVAVF